MGTALAVLTTVGVLLLAGWGLGDLLRPTTRPLIRLAVGVAAVLAALLLGAWHLAWLGHVQLVPAWAMCVLVPTCAAGAVRLRRGGRLRPAVLRATVLRPAVLVWAVPLMAAVLLRAALVASWTLPPGWDPSFHLLLASRIEETASLPTSWLPYEPIDLHYPLAAHALLAGVPAGSLEQRFAVLLAVGSSLLVVQTAALAQAVRLPTSAVGVSATLMALGVWMGGLGYLGWGGLPSLLATVLFLGLLVLVLDRPRRHVNAGAPRRFPWPVTGLTALTAAAMVLTHHHLMVSGGVALLAAVVALRRWDLLPGAAAGLTLSAAGWMPLAVKAGRLGETTVHVYVEELLTPPRLAGELGFAFAAALLLTPLLWGSPVGRQLRRSLLGPPLAVLLAAWLVLDHGCRLVAWLQGLEPFTLFTPSRFLTVAVPLLAVVAGGAVVAAAGRLKLTGVAPTLVVAAVSVVAMLPRYRELTAVDPVPLPWRQAAAWVAANAGPDVLVLNGMTVHPDARAWLCYLTRRPTTYTPVPTSEPVQRLPSPEDKVAAAREVWDVREAKWVIPTVHEVLHVTSAGGADAVAVSRVRRGQPSVPSIGQP